MLLTQSEPAFDTPHTSLLRRLGLARSPAPASAAASTGAARFLAVARAIKAAQPSPEPRPSQAQRGNPAPAPQPAAGARHMALRIDPASGSGIEAGLVVQDGALWVWAIDRAAPDRQLAVSVLRDGQAIFVARLPGSDALVQTGCTWAVCRSLVLVCEDRMVARECNPVPLPLSAVQRADLRTFLSEERARSRKRALRRRLHTAIPTTLARLQRLDNASDPIPAVIRHFVRRADASINATRLGLASWIIGELMEDPSMRDAYCLDDRTAAILNEPAFNADVLRADVTLALLCFWRRHYQSIDLFSIEGLRRVQNRFVTAPFMAHHTNMKLVTPAIRAQLMDLVPGAKAGDLPWCWHWYLMFKEDGQAANLNDPAFAVQFSLKEVVADALDPQRLSFTPGFWSSYWSGWHAGRKEGSDVPFSRFDLAMVAVLADTAAPDQSLAEQGASYWRQRLIDDVYRPMPGLTRLSLACPHLPEPVPAELPQCDVALIGHCNGTGLARNMDMFANALAPLQPLVFDQRTGQCTNPPASSPFGLRADEVRARLVIICANADLVPEILGRFAHLCEDAVVCGFFLWETDRPPETHRLGAHLVDEIWTPTSFVANAYRGFTDVPVSVVGKGLFQPNPRRYATRAVVRRASNAAFTFLVVAEFASSIVRKNPQDAVRAFQMAFDKDNRGVRLVLKLRDINPNHWSNIDGYWEETERLIQDDPRIEIVSGDLPEEDYWALVASADCILSLHRGEGFAYFIGDAMMMGKPVIVSDFSGPCDFCTAETSFPVAVDVVPAPAAHLRTTGAIGNWAQPDIASAAAAMRTVVADPAEMARRASVGQRRALEMFDPNDWAERLLARVAPLLPRLGGRVRPPVPVAPVRKPARGMVPESPVRHLAHAGVDGFHGAVHRRCDD